jgi:hypothetical protein
MLCLWSLDFVEGKETTFSRLSSCGPEVWNQAKWILGEGQGGNLSPDESRSCNFSPEQLFIVPFQASVI